MLYEQIVIAGDRSCELTLARDWPTGSNSYWKLNIGASMLYEQIVIAGDRFCELTLVTDCYVRSDYCRV